MTEVPAIKDARVPDWQALPADAKPVSCDDIQRTMFANSAISIPLRCTGGAAGHPLTLEIVRAGAQDWSKPATYNPRQNGSVSNVVNGSVVYKPKLGFVGQDTFYYLAHTNLDQRSTVATVTIDVKQRPGTLKLPATPKPTACRACSPR